MAASQINLTWTFRNDGTDGKADDILYFVVYNPALNEWASYPNQDYRDEEVNAVDLPEHWGLPDLLHAWCAFLSSDNLVASNTQYLLIES